MSVHEIRPVSAHPSVMPVRLNIKTRTEATMSQRIGVQQSIAGHTDALVWREMPDDLLLTRAAILLAETHGGPAPDDVRLLEIAACMQLILERRVVEASK